MGPWLCGSGGRSHLLLLRLPLLVARLGIRPGSFSLDGARSRPVPISGRLQPGDPGGLRRGTAVQVI